MLISPAPRRAEHNLNLVDGLQIVRGSCRARIELRSKWFNSVVNSMPYYFEFNSAIRILRCRFEGLLTDEILREYYRIAPKYVALHAPCSGIFDMLSVNNFEVTPPLIRELAALAPIIPDPASPRFIVAPTPQMFGMARMFELQGQHTRPNLHVVRSLKEVWVILGIEEQPPFVPIAME
jgi:hypothetical protein